MKMQFVCLLLVLLSVTVLSRDAEDIEDIEDVEVIESRYEKFKRQHIYEKDGKESCDVMMKNVNTKKCKPINTFILAKEEEVKSICNLKKNETVMSSKYFNLIVCEQKVCGAKYPKCNYAILKKKRKICIECVNNEPVHYGGDIDDN